VAVVYDGSPSRPAVLAARARTVRGSRSDSPQPGGRSCSFPARSPDAPSSGPDGPQPGGKSCAFPARSPDGLSSGPDGPRWRSVVFFSSYDLDLAP
jgi:hypothetical protein